MSTWRALISSVAKASVRIGAGWIQVSMAANCAPPAKTRADISVTSSGDRPFAAATAPNRRPIGKGRDRDRRDVAQAGPDFAARCGDEGACSDP